MYQVLYRKWRPKVFSDVVGQPQVTVTLCNALKAGRVSHAYLFTGSRGTGKTTCAKILAKAVNCLSPINGDPCGECEICRGIENGSVLDISEIDAASNNGVENIRDLREEVNFTPAIAKYRVYIIDEVHMLSSGAFNALLKTLEEPPSHVIFILATTELHKIPATILSRCQRLDFHRISPDAMAERLEYISEQEGAVLEHEAALMIARLADGALRDALSLLDQCIGRNKHVTVDVVTNAAGLSGTEYLVRITDALAEGDVTQILATVKELHEASKDMVRLAEELVSHFRNIMLYKAMKDPKSVMTVGAGEMQELDRQAHLFSLESVLSIMEKLQDSIENMSRGSNRRLELEMTLVRIASPALDAKSDSVLQRIDKLEQMIKKGIVVEAAPKAEAKSAAEPKKKVEEKKELPEPTVPALESEPTTLCKQWNDIIETLHGISPGLSAFLDNSKAYIRGEFLLIDAPNEAAFELLRKHPEQKEKMRRAIQIVTGKVYKLGPYREKEEKVVQTSENDPINQLFGMAAEAGIEITGA